jgi:hypothetical protein
MTERVADFESLLRQALAPVEPPAELEERLEQTLGSLVGMAADELESWELSAVKDPKNWIRLARPAAAVVIGSGAAVGLVLVRTQRRRHGRRREAVNRLDLVGRTLRDLSREAKRVVDDVF